MRVNAENVDTSCQYILYSVEKRFTQPIRPCELLNEITYYTNFKGQLKHGPNDGGILYVYGVQYNIICFAINCRPADGHRVTPASSTPRWKIKTYLGEFETMSTRNPTAVDAFFGEISGAPVAEMSSWIERFLQSRGRNVNN